MPTPKIPVYNCGTFWLAALQVRCARETWFLLQETMHPAPARLHWHSEVTSKMGFLYVLYARSSSYSPAVNLHCLSAHTYTCTHTAVFKPHSSKFISGYTLKLMYKETNLPVYSTWSHHTHSHYRRSVCTNKQTSYILHVTDSLNCWHSGLSTIYPVFVVRYIHISVGCIVCTGRQLCSGHNHAAKWNVSQRVLTCSPYGGGWQG